MDIKDYNFIETYENAFELCDETIDFFEKNEHLAEERDEEHKENNIDDLFMFLIPNHKDPLPSRILKETERCIKKNFELYKEKYSFSRPLINHTGLMKYGISGCKLQKTLPGKGFNFWHTEKLYDRTFQNNFLEYQRFLVYTIYLNDIEDGGETAFLYQDVKIKPKKGTLCLFPADFSYVHKGIPPIRETKYILTGWLVDTVLN